MSDPMKYDELLREALALAVHVDSKQRDAGIMLAARAFEAAVRARSTEDTRGALRRTEVRGSPVRNDRVRRPVRVRRSASVRAARDAPRETHAPRADRTRPRQPRWLCDRRRRRSRPESRPQQSQTTALRRWSDMVAGAGFEPAPLFRSFYSAISATPVIQNTRHLPGVSFSRLRPRLLLSFLLSSRPSPASRPPWRPGGPFSVPARPCASQSRCRPG